MKQKISISELTRQAFWFAEKYCASAAISSPEPDGAEAKKDAELAEMFRAYRVKRWGKSQSDLNDEKYQAAKHEITFCMPGSDKAIKTK